MATRTEAKGLIADVRSAFSSWRAANSIIASSQTAVEAAMQFRSLHDQVIDGLAILQQAAIPAAAVTASRTLTAWGVDHARPHAHENLAARGRRHAREHPGRRPRTRPS